MTLLNIRMSGYPAGAWQQELFPVHSHGFEVEYYALLHTQMRLYFLTSRAPQGIIATTKERVATDDLPLITGAEIIFVVHPFRV